MVAHSLRAEGFDASEDGTGRGTPLVPIVMPTMRAGAPGNSAGHGARSGDNKDEYIVPVLGFNHNAQVAQVRRLTPRECERLQGFPDDYTLVTYRGKPAADGPRYKALGNSMCTRVMAWIGRRIDLISVFQ